jgi:hypothetical protein
MLLCFYALKTLGQIGPRAVEERFGAKDEGKQVWYNHHQEYKAELFNNDGKHSKTKEYNCNCVHTWIKSNISAKVSEGRFHMFSWYSLMSEWF